MSAAVCEMESGGLRLERSQWKLLILTGLTLWVIVYALLNLSWFSLPAPHQAERAARRLLTCSAGLGLCLAMTPVIARAALAPMGERILIALGASLLAYVLHLCFRLAVFHLVQPLWGPLSGDVFMSALRGGGWMFPLWSAICLMACAEARATRTSERAKPSDEPLSHFWCQDGRRRVRVDLKDLTLLAAEGDYVRLHTGDRQHLIRGRLKDFASSLPTEQFMRVHRSSIVRLDAVRALERSGSIWRIRMRDGVEALVSRPMSKAVRTRIDVGSSACPGDLTSRCRDAP